MNRIAMISILALLASAGALAQPLDTSFTYQGQLKNAGATANGLHDLRFRLYDAAADGAQVGSTLCLDNVSVADGLFTTALDFGVVFSGQKRFLEIDVRSNTGLGCADTTGYTTLTPRQELTATPNASFAGNTSSLGGAPASAYARLNGNQTFNGLFTFTNATLFPSASNNVTFSTPSAGPNLSHVHYGITGDWYIRSAFSGGKVIIQDTAGNVGIGTSNPAQKLSVAGTVESTSGGFKFPDGSTQATAAGTGVWVTSGTNIFSSNTGNVGIGTNTPASKLDIDGDIRISGAAPNALSVFNAATQVLDLGVAGVAGQYSSSAQANDVVLRNNVAGKSIFLQNGSGAAALAISSNNVGIGTSTPGFPLSFSNTLGDKIALWGQSGANYGFGIQGGLLQIHGSAAADDIAFGYGTSAAFTERMRVKGNGNVGIGTPTPASRLHVDGSSDLVPLQVEGDNGNGTWLAIGNSSVSQANKYWQIITTGGLNGDGSLVLGTGPQYNQVAINAMVISTTGLATFSNRVSATSIEIRGGADITEGFDSQAKDIEPGTLMVIDPAHPGQLMPSSQAYDSKVAGIVSGAGGVAPGIKMGQDGKMDGKHAVALTGRVYVKCTTSGGAIQPGDLLTTSDLAGHAMKAADRTRAPGATIGKAMSALDRGDGQVLVLVNLQ